MRAGWILVATLVVGLASAAGQPCARQLGGTGRIVAFAVGELAGTSVDRSQFGQHSSMENGGVAWLPA